MTRSRSIAIIAAAGAGAFITCPHAARAQCGITKLVDDNPNILSFMGSTCDVTSYRLVLGAPAGGQSGRAVFFERSDGGWGGLWTEDGEFASPLAPASDGYAQAVACSGNTIAVGAPLSDIGGDTNTGRVYIYFRSLFGWDLEQILENPSPDDDDLFGASLAFGRINDAVFLAVGVPGDDLAGAPGAGRVRIYVDMPGEGWVLQDTVTSTDIDTNEQFGASVSFSAERLAVGAPGEDYSGMNDAGAAYVFQHASGFQWENGLRFLAPIGYRETGDMFGKRVALSEDRIAIGAPNDDNPGVTDCGAIYVYHTNGVVWSMEQRVQEIAPGSFDHIGEIIDLKLDLLVAGDPSDNLAWLWRRNTASGDWEAELARSATEPPASAHSFGSSISISGSGDWLAVGDAGDDLPGFGGAGSAYLFLADQAPAWDCAGGFLNPVPEIFADNQYFGCTGGGNDGFTLCAVSSGDAWYRYTAPCTGILELATCGTNDFFGQDSGIDTVLSVQRGCPGDKIFFEACNDDFPDGNAPDACYFPSDDGVIRDSALRVHVIAGEEYRVRVASRGPAGPYGQFMLNVGFTCCGVDWDGNGVVNSTDVSAFINDWFDDQANGTKQAEFNGDGVVNSTDVSDFISAWFEGCPS